jgi:hypothetical protein
VDRLDNWLTEVAGMPIWYDSRSLPASATIGNALPDAIVRCRSMMIILSESSVASQWVIEEYNAAMGQRTRFKDYRIIPIRIDTCDPPGLLQTTKWIDVPDGQLTLESACQLLTSLHRGESPPGVSKTRDVYISRGWRESESAIADWVCRLVAEAGFRLIGDSKDQPSFDQDQRVRSIIASCGALAAVLPHRGGGRTSTYILQEIRIARELGLAVLLAADPNVVLPEDLDECVRLSYEPSTGDSSELRGEIERLLEDWKAPARRIMRFSGPISRTSTGAEIRSSGRSSNTSLACHVLWATTFASRMFRNSSPTGSRARR